MFFSVCPPAAVLSNCPRMVNSELSTFTDYHPTGGEASQANALLSKDGNKYFQQTYADYILGFQDDFRGDVNLNTTDGYYGRMRGGAFNSNP